MELVLALNAQSGVAKAAELKVFESEFHAFLANLSKSTAQVYGQSVIEFLAFAVKNLGLRSPGELKRQHIIYYRDFLDKTGKANKTVLKKLSAVSSFCKFLAGEGLIDKDIVYGVKRPRQENKRETADLSDKDVKKLFAGMNRESFYYVHHRALLAVGFYTGLRSREIRHLKIKNYAKVDGHMVITCLIKGGKRHEVPLNPFVVRCLDEHLQKLSEIGFFLSGEHYLFPSIKTRQNKPIGASALNELFKKRLEDAGIEMSSIRRYSPHTMRSTLAGHLLNTVEAPLEQVQQTLGHSSPTTTMAYNKRVRNHDKSPVYKIEY